MSTPPLSSAGVLVLWLAAGLVTGAWLWRQGHPPATAVAALVAWPLLLVLGPAPAAPGGPYAERIRRAFEGTAALLAEAGAPGAGELDALREAVTHADRRLALVDAVLHGSDGAPQASLARLQEAREVAGAEVESVLEELVGMRISVGLLALAPGEADAVVSEQLCRLRARLQAVDELARLG